ncbi:ABC transporter substrate-binding protein [Defluviimonas sp. WL0002]|uniref:ABC transporter substrate-binding protein n=1 Tax=Albidovulum marisflavi TaxID=2984159 RepID=A0ABT2ZEQ0_9RHOB|nr:ABC transporter substrate-binding protein [Defluviimonas sp. WL0002]MCV2869609.1 ABC transporter substrate-binding protein [Defluviimonas sp. WL0002]
MLKYLLCTLAVVASGSTVARAQGLDVMIATWRGCEDACQGFKDHMASLGQDVRLTVRDAGQDKAVLPRLLGEARASEADLIVSWGTSVTKAIAGDLTQLEDPAFNHDIPQVFMIVADPVGSGLVESLDDTGRPNLTGTYNRMPETVTIQTIRSYLPGFGTLGLIYNENEPNSVLKYQELQELSKTEGFELVALALPLTQAGQPSVEDISPKVREVAQAGADFLYVGSSSFLQANSAILGAAVRDAKLPLISPYEEAAREGNALLSVAASYYEVGRLAGRQAAAILFDGARAGDLPVARMSEFAVTINLSMAKQIGLYPPVNLIQIAEIVE